MSMNIHSSFILNIPKLEVSKYPSAEQLNKLLYTYTMEFYSAIKKSYDTCAINIYDSTYVRYPWKSKSYKQKVEWWLPRKKE